PPRLPGRLSKLQAAGAPWMEGDSSATSGEAVVRPPRVFHASAGLPLVPALEEGASEGAAEYLVHQPGGGRFLVDLDPLGVDGERREDVAVPSGALRRRGADVARRPGVVR